MYAEKDFQTMFSKWLVRHPTYFDTAVFELKICKKKSLPFTAVKPHQRRSLKLAQKCLIWKIPDDSMGEKPFDCFQIKDAESFVAILWYVPRKPKEFTLIEVDAYIAEMESSKRKSLTKDRACDIGILYNLNE